MRPTRLLTGSVVGLAGLLLSGCAGSASPGVAVAIGDDSISTSRVDTASAHVCTALDAEFRGNGTVLPMGFIRQGVVQLLALSSQAQQIAEQYDVAPGSAYERDLAQRERTASAFPAEVRDDYVAVMSANALANGVLDAAGRAKLADEGFTKPTVEQVTQAGTEIFTTWPDAHGVRIDPRYGVALVDGKLSPVDTNLSVAVGDDAKAGLATEPDTVYAQTLPAHHRCG